MLPTELAERWRRSARKGLEHAVGAAFGGVILDPDCELGDRVPFRFRQPAGELTGKLLG